MKNRNYHACAIAVLLVAAAFRLWQLGLKPPHFDEGINGWFVDQMKPAGAFRYNPTNFHGPLLFYILFAAQTLFGRAVEVLRLPGALAGVLVVALAIYGYRRHLGGGAALLYGACLAVSPAMVFVSRYAIHEIWMLLFCMMTALGILEVWAGRCRMGCWWFWSGLAGMVLMKETYVIHLTAFLLAWPTLLLFRRWLAPDELPAASAPGRPAPREIVRASAVPALVAALLVIFFYSGNLLYPGDLKGLWTTFATWTETGKEGAGHEKVWYYWFGLMARYEWAALAGLAACMRFCFRSPGPLRWLVISGVGAAMAYQIIPYKTPWCILMVSWTFPLALAWTLADAAARGFRIMTAGLAALVLAHGVWASWRLNYVNYDAPDEPYVYVQTSREIGRFTEPLLAASRRDPRILHAPGAIVVDSAYPLPWLLGDFSRTGYYGAALRVEAARMDFLLVQQSRREEIEAMLAGTWIVRELRLRDAFEPVAAYFRSEVFGPELPGETAREFGKAGGADR